MLHSRRRFASLVMGAALPDALRAQEQAQPLLPSGAFEFVSLPVRKNETAEFRAIFKGKTATGEEVEIHHTTVTPGERPHAGHHHVHNELWLLCEGEGEFTVNGKSSRMGPGSVGYASSNDEHAIRNVGATAARYFIVAIGPGASMR